MQMGALLPKIGGNDFRNIRRDSFYLFMLGYVVVIGIFLRYALPWLNVVMAENGVLPNARMPISLADLYPMLVAYFCLFIMVLLPGTVYGFMLLDEKDDNTLNAMLVTPIPLQQFLGYRLSIVTALAFVIVLSMIYIVDQALLPLWQILMLAAGASLAAPITALCFGIFAENKVQGFCLFEIWRHRRLDGAHRLVRRGAVAVAAGTLSPLLGEQGLLDGAGRPTILVVGHC